MFLTALSGLQVEANLYKLGRGKLLLVPTQDMLADVLTKEMKIPKALEDVILKNKISLSQPLVNEVKAVGTEIRMVNIRNR